MEPEAPQVFTYRIDASDALSFVSDAWVDFARRNDAAELTRDAVLGRPIWDFICDAETRYVYELLFERVRSQKSGIWLPFRCDSPRVRRYMVLEVIRFDDELELRSALLSAQARPPIALLETPAKPGKGEVLSLCGWCKRVSTCGAWLELEDAIDHLDLFAGSELPPISHVTCPDCYEHAMNVLRSEMASPSA